jgi:hypothetical protein
MASTTRLFACASIAMQAERPFFSLPGFLALG